MDETDIVVDLPVICTRGMIVFPGHEISLDVGRNFSLKAIDRSVNEFDENIIFISQKNPLDDLQALRNISMVVACGNLIANPKVKKLPEVEKELDKFL